MKPLTQANGLLRAFAAFAVTARSTWAKGPVPCWTDYLHDTSDKA